MSARTHHSAIARGTRNDLAVSIRTGLRYAPTSPDAGQRVPDSNLEAGITPWGRPDGRRGLQLARSALPP